MIVATVYVESGCEFKKGEYYLGLDAFIKDQYCPIEDHDKLVECIEEYDGTILPEVEYTFFLKRAHIGTAFPGYEPAFAIWQVLENIQDIDIML